MSGPGLAVVEPTKVCARCSKRQPWSQFWAKAKWPDGSMRQPHARCKICAREKTRDRQRRRRQENPEVVRAIDRARYRRNMQSAEWRARRREIVRRAQRKQMEIPPERWRVVEVEAECDQRFPIGPFRDWLKAHCDGHGVLPLARMLGIGEKRMQRWIGLNETIGLSEVDAAGIAMGEPWLLNELYPIGEELAA